MAVELASIPLLLMTQFVPSNVKLIIELAFQVFAPFGLIIGCAVSPPTFKVSVLLPTVFG